MTGFLEFWQAYPKKRARLDAMKAYQQALKLATPDEILAGVHRYCQHLPEDMRFVKLPAGWLRDGRWDDEYDVPVIVREPVESRATCRHTPTCPSNEWHSIMLKREQAA